MERKDQDHISFMNDFRIYRKRMEGVKFSLSEDTTHKISAKLK